MSVMNQAYSKLNSAKVKDGLARRRAAGHYAVGYCPFGYRYIDGVVEPDPEQWGPARERWETASGHGNEPDGVLPEIRRCFAFWPYQLDQESRCFVGLFPHQRGGVKPLISPEEWQQAQVLLKHRATTRTSSTRRQHLLSGLVVCDSCGRSLWNQTTAYGRLRLKCPLRPLSVVWTRNSGRGCACSVNPSAPR